MKKILIALILTLMFSQSAFAGKVIDLDQKMVDFEGKNIKQGPDNANDVTLKQMLLGYLMQAHLTSLTDIEKITAYEAGVLIGSHSGKFEVDQTIYDVIKKLSDNPKTKNQQGQESPMYGIILTGQVKKMVDGAETK